MYKIVLRLRYSILLDETASKTEDWVAKKSKKLLLGIVGAIAIGTLSYLLYNRFVVEPNEEKSCK